MDGERAWFEGGDLCASGGGSDGGADLSDRGKSAFGDLGDFADFNGEVEAGGSEVFGDPFADPIDSDDAGAKAGGGGFAGGCFRRESEVGRVRGWVHFRGLGRGRLTCACGSGAGGEGKAEPERKA